MIGKSFGQYEIVALLGRGGMGEVYRARDSKLERDVAIKILSPSQTDDADAKARFLREARTASALDHPNICAIHQVDETPDGQFFIVMAHYRGQTLSDCIKAGRLEREQALNIGGQIASGIAKAHTAGIVHRDLKPSNVMITEDGLAKILDFGLAKMTGDETITRTGTSMGTPSYMSPEQVRAQPISAQSDIWSLSVLLYELITGNPPFHRGELAPTLSAILHDEPEDIRKRAPDLDESIAAAIMSGLHKDPDLRPESLDTLLLALGLPPSGAPAVTISRTLDMRRTIGADDPTEQIVPPKPRNLAPLFRAIGMVILVAVISGGFWAWIQRPAPSLHVLLLPPEVVSEAEDSATEITAINLQTSIARALGGRESVVVIPIESADAPIGELTKQYGADEALRSRAVAQGPGWQVQLSRLDAEGSIRWTEQFAAPGGDGLDLASAVAAHVGEGYSERAVAEGVAILRVKSEDYASYLEINNSFMNDQSRVNLDSLLVKLGDIEHSSPRFVDALLLGGSIARYLFTLSKEDSYFERGREYLARAQLLSPREERVIRHHFELSLAGGNLDAADEALERLTEISPGSIAIPSMQAQLAQQRNEFDQAITFMKESVARQPTSWNLMDLADLQYQQNRFDGARETLNRLLAMGAQQGYAAAKLAEIELLHGDPTRAAELYGVIVQENGDASEYNNLGLAQQLLGEFALAEQSFRKAESFAPDNEYILLNLADCIAAQGLLEDARVYYGQIVAQLDETDENLDWADRLVVAQCQAQLGDHNAAVGNTQLALQSGAGDAEAYFMASLVYCLTEARVPALVNAKEALRLGYSARWFGLPWFDQLRDDPEFLQLTSPTP